MSTLTLRLEFTDNLGLKSITFAENTSGLIENSSTIISIAKLILRASESNKEALSVFDLLQELGINKE